MRYTLYKLSDPGFQLVTNHEIFVRDILEMYVCKLCKTNHGTYHDSFPENYKDLSVTDQIQELLTTDCGCEFDFSDEDKE